ncbi:protein HAIKU1-like [Musa acuminata AAA Group]|uniref:protein HAIKU1-like n=1 Tax=Musa acuminata AAA Group TaxID=214697 RepID=UPI0031D99123
MESSRNQHSLGVNKAIKKEGPRQPRVYNIRSSDFRSVVQQLTGASASLPRPRRLNQARPQPLDPLPRPSVPTTPADPAVPPPAETPFSAYMRFLEISLLHSDGSHRPAHSPLRPSPPPPLPLDLESPSAFLDLLSPRCPQLSP